MPTKTRGRHISLTNNLGPLFINPRRVVERILVRVSGWAGLGNTAAFLKQRDIRNGIEECRRELAACADRFMVSRPYDMKGS